MIMMKHTVPAFPLQQAEKLLMNNCKKAFLKAKDQKLYQYQYIFGKSF
jgi:hypothetical protein